MTAPESRLNAGDASPAFELLDQDGLLFSSASLNGKNRIIYFYPAANSPGCSKEAADFQDHFEEFTRLGYEIVGISPDKPAKLKDFEDAHQLTFKLLSDPDLIAHKTFGAYGEKTLYGRTYRGVIRSTVVVNAQDKVTGAFYNVKSTGHISMLLKHIS